MRKIIAALLSLTLCLMLPVSAFAAETDDLAYPYDVCLTVDDTGDGICVELTALTAVTDGVVTITYDAETVTITEEDIKAADSVDMYSVNASEQGTVKISWISAEAAQGTLFTMGFVLADGAEITEDTFHLSGDVRDADNNVMTLADPSNREKTDKSALQALYDASLKLSESAYTADSWAALVAAQEAALAVLEDDWATQAQIDSALAVLADAIAGLVLADTAAEVDKTALQSLYSASLLLTQDDYTADSWAALVAAQEAALAVLEDADATQEEVDAAWLALLNAINGLEEAEDAGDTVNKDALLTAYENSLKLDEESYTEDTWATLVEAQEAVLAVLEDADATQEEVDAALEALIAALQGLTEKETTAQTNKDALQAAYESSLTLEESSYTEDTWAALKEAQTAALAVLEDTDATQEEIDAALSALLTAIGSLVLSGTSDKTGDTTPIVAVSLVALAAAAAVCCLVVMKAKREKR